jgi:23S rRNA (uridine2552-2'-O)-methyltransferase
MSRGERDLKVRVRAAGRTQASRRWLERQLNDPYVARAKREGLRSRAAFKLTEIDDKHRLLKPGAKVVDLGAAPGGWSQVAAKRVRAGAGGGRVVAIDLLAMDPLPGVECLQLDFLDPEAPERLKALLGGPADVVLTDMAANATAPPGDHLRIMGLAEAPAGAREVLRPGGVALAPKEGRNRGPAARLAQARFWKRQASSRRRRSDSAELYVLATEFRGRAGL